VSDIKAPNLFKFVSAQSATGILSDQKLIWHSPDCFSDPFELNSRSIVTIERAALLEATISLAASMIFAPGEPQGDSPLINTIKRWRAEKRFHNHEEATALLLTLLPTMVDYRLVQLETAMTKWQEFVRNIRICSFCAQVDNLIAWERYGDLHRGLVIEFAADAFANAKPVIYQNERPYLTNLREQLSYILHNRKDKTTERFNDHLFIKGAFRKAEQEIRCITETTQEIPLTNTHVTSWWDQIPFAPQQIQAVYFGINTDPNVKSHILQLINNQYPHANVFQTHTSKTGYALEFEAI
jgi:hypothetical protein